MSFPPRGSPAPLPPQATSTLRTQAMTYTCPFCDGDFSEFGLRAHDCPVKTPAASLNGA